MRFLLHVFMGPCSFDDLKTADTTGHNGDQRHAGQDEGVHPTVPAEVADTTGHNGDHRHAGQDEDVHPTVPAEVGRHNWT